MTSLDDTTPRVRVVVLNWNTAWLTARCLRSLQVTDYPADRLEIVVVDNASIDGSYERLRHDFPELTFVRNEANVGFAEGCNRAMRDVLRPDRDVDLVALINNDSTVDPGWLRPLVEVMQADPRIGAACPKILLETPDGDGVRRINSVGLALTRQSEGIELRRDEPDDPGASSEPGLLDPGEVDGFSGGAVVLRAAALADVGLFDPAFFAYCEDLDLSWRLRRQGWRIVCVPAAVTHHLLHGSGGGPTSPFFFFAYFRNWLLMVLRNGSVRDIVLAYRNAFGRTWTTRSTRGQEWIRVWIAVAAGAPAVVATRFGGRRPGWERPGRVGSRLMPRPVPKPPVPRPGGPTIVYLDVSHTLVTRLRAGIQRVVRELVTHLPVIRPDVDLVPVVWSRLHDGFRRVDAAEYAELLAPAGHRSAPTPVPVKRWRKIVRLVAGPVIDAVRRRRDLRREPIEHRDLLIDRLASGAVFLDVDASWNRVTAPRATLLPQLVADDVTVMALICDVLPVTHPEWFEPHTVRDFRAHVDAHASADDLVMVISHHTESDYRAIDPTTPVRVITLGSDVLADGGAPPEVLADARYLLTVGTIEPRKGHDVLLAAYDELHERHPELHLVIVGREGWGSADVVDRLRRHASSDDHVHWFHQATDDELAALYRHAFVVVIPSLEEGYGLPLAEALGVGAVVVSSRAGALPEVGGEHAEYFDPRRPDELATRLERHLSDPEHHEARRAAAKGFVPRRWDDVVAEVGQAVVSAVGRSSS